MLKFLSFMLRTFEIRLFFTWDYLGTSLIIGTLMRIRVASVALGTDFAQDFDLIVDLDPIDVDDVAPPTVKLTDAKRHASLLSSFLSNNSLYFGLVLMELLVFKGSREFR